MIKMTPIIDKINVIGGAIVALLSYILGEHWCIFAFYLFLNCGDCVSRWIAARITKTESSKACSVGILKKLGYWLMIAIAFGMSSIFIELGTIIGIDLKVTTYIGWFVLCTLIINEIRSILENLVEGGYKVPKILIKGLEVVDKTIDGKVDKETNKEE